MPAAYPHPQLVRPLGQQGLGARLGQEQGVRMAAVQRGEVQRGVEGGEVPSRQGPAEPQEAGGEPAQVHQFQAAGMQGQRPGVLVGLGAALDDQGPYAGQCQLAGEQQPGRSRAHDDHIGIHR